MTTEYANHLAEQFVHINSVEQLTAIILEFHSMSFEDKNKFLNYVLGYIHGLRQERGIFG